MAGKKVLVLGGGFGGAAAARTASALLGAAHRVTLVDRNRLCHLCGSFPLLIVGERAALQVRRSLTDLAATGVHYQQAEVRTVDAAAKTVRTSAGTLEYDYLVLAPGAVYDWDAVPGARGAYSFYDLEAAQRLRRRLAAFRRGRVVIAVSSVPYKCPPAPYETALVLEWALKQRGVRKDVEMHVFTPEPVPLAAAAPEVGAQLAADLTAKGIQLHTNAGIREVAASGRECAFTDGASMDAALVITVPVHRPPEFVAEAGLTGKSGWIEVAPQTLETRLPGVYAIGDVNMVPMGNGRGLPKAGVFASAEGETVGRNITSAILGTAPAVFPGEGHCFVLYGGERAGALRGQFLAAGKPSVTFQRPSASGYREKVQFEADWRAFQL